MIRIKKARAATLLAALIVTLGAAGCECDDPMDASIVITAPAHPSSITLADDTNSSIDGVQIIVTANVIGLAVGDQIDVQVDGNVQGTASVPAAGPISWNDVTIQSGVHTVVAVTREGGLRSNEVTVTLNDSCFAVTVVTPDAMGGSLTLGAMDDTDGMACGATFESEVVASTTAPDDSDARVFVNGTPRRSARVSGGVVRFDGVGFDNRGATPNTIRVEVTDPTGITCSGELGAQVFVDCDGASCAITLPDTTTAFLNSTDDVSASPGFQGNFETTTDSDGSGNPVRLVIDGDETGALTDTPSGTVASFMNVDLTEGLHRVYSECRDGTGNVTRSGTAEWTVDITPCDVTMASPVAGTLFTMADDVNPGATGIQINAMGTAASDCTGLRVLPCPGAAAAPFETASATWTTEATLDSAAMQELCAQTTDEAGNIGEARVALRVRTDAPQVEFDSPNTSFNVAGTMGRTADLVLANSTCDAVFSVFCTDVGIDVTISHGDTMALLGTAPCLADVGVLPPYMGRADFAMVPLPTINDGSSFPLVAAQTDGLIGETTISVTSDCIAPTELITRPVCGTTLSAAMDEMPATPGTFEYATNVTNTDPMADVTLTIAPSGGGAPTYMATDTTVTALVSFPAASYGVGGMLDIVASATDNAGNLGTSAACSVTVDNIPSLAITEPAMGAVLSTADDCLAGGTMQMRITGITDAPVGSTVDVTIMGVMTSDLVGAGGAISICVDAPDGRDLSVLVSVTDARGMASVTIPNVTIDTMPPTDAIDDLSVVSVLNRRDGIVQFRWTDVLDAGGVGFLLSSYEMRCASSPILDETDWGNATVFPIAAGPGMMTVQMEDIDGFRPGQTLQCVMRGTDPAGSLTPIPAAMTPVVVDFLFQTVTPTMGLRIGGSVAAVGNVNDDAGLFPDVLAGGQGFAALYYGGAALGSAPDVIFTNATGWSGLGDLSVAGLGDINGDSIPDMAMGDAAGASFKGRVFIVYGRPAGSPFDAVCELDTLACPVDVVITSEDGVVGMGPDEAAFLGLQISPAGDFNNDGLMDLLINAIGANGFPGGLAYIILGRPTATPLAAAIDLPLDDPDGFIITGPAGATGVSDAIATVGGSVNGDAFHDLVVGASVTAEAFMVFGQAHTVGSGLITPAASSFLVFDTGIANQFPQRAAPAGDIDGDGMLDLALFASSSSARGDILLYRGTATGFNMTARVTVLNDVADRDDDRFGTTLGIARHPEFGVLGDIDRDGRADTLAGSLENGLDADGASAELFYNDAFVNRNRSEGVSFDNAAGEGPRTAAFAGDVNNDGFPDIVVGDPAAGATGRMVIIY